MSNPPTHGRRRCVLIVTDEPSPAILGIGMSTRMNDENMKHDDARDRDDLPTAPPRLTVGVDPVPVVVTPSPVDDDVRLERLIARLLRMILDETQRREQLAHALQRARESERLKSQFLASTSFEMRSPLNALINIPDGLLADFTPMEGIVCQRCRAAFELEPDEQFDRETPCLACGQVALTKKMRWIFRGDGDEHVVYLCAIADAGRQLLDMVNRLAELSHLEAAHTRLHLQDVELTTLLGQIERRYTPLAGERGLRLVVTAPLSVSLVADPHWLMQVLVNLLDNAFKFSPDGATIQLAVTAATAADPTRCEIMVRDEGPGLPVEAQRMIFGDAIAVDDGPAHPMGATGIGLALVKKLVEIHDGTIVVESKPGRGTTFRVRLPLAGPRPRAAL